MAILRNKTTHSDEPQIVEGLKTGDERITGYVCNHYFNDIKKMVYSFKNTILIPEDIFQEGLTRAIINIRDDKFHGDSKFGTYLNSICRNICLKELQKNSKSSAGELHENIQEETNGINFELLELIAMLQKKLKKDCIDIIDFRFNLNEDEKKVTNKLMSFDEIAQHMNLTAANTRQRFKRCMDQLKQMAFANSEIMDMLN